MKTSPALRIIRLRTLIDHPATGSGERAAAQRMLDRILAKSVQARGARTDRDYGARHARAGRHAGLAEIAEMIGQDIMLERLLTAPATSETSETSDVPAAVAVPSPLRDAPTTLTYTVDVPAAGAIVVTIGNIPPDWGAHICDGVETVAPALQSVAEAVAEIMNAYNHDGADTGKRFFGKVRAGGTTLVW